MYYFDHAASSPIYPEVLETLFKAQREDFANPSSQHILGHDLAVKIEEWREDFLKALGARRDDVFIYTSSATEANNTVVNGLGFNEGDVILYCKADHPSLTLPIEQAAKRLGAILKPISLKGDGTIDLSHLQSQLDHEVKLVALTHVNNQNGIICDVDEVLKVIKDNSSAHVHIDAVQSFGKLPLKILPGIDSMCITSHKIGGPKGIAGLFLKKGHGVKPLLFGGGQEHGLRPSTEPFPLIAAFHHAMRISLAEKANALSGVSSMNETIRSAFSTRIPAIQFPFSKVASPYILGFILPNIPSDVILRHLETRNVFISSTSACSSRIQGLNPTLLAMGIPERFHKNFLRISLGPQTTPEEVDVLIREFISVWEDLKHVQKK